MTLYAARVRLSAALPEQSVSAFSQILSQGRDFPVSVTRENNHHKGIWILEFLSAEEPDAKALAEQVSPLQPVSAADVIIEKLPENTDWLAHSYRQFPPFTVGPFYIHGSHEDSHAEAEHIALQIDAATAFGSGEHGTTKGCLLAMLDLKEAGVCPWNVLDMGTGSGILGIAAWKLWKTPVLAVDNDAEAVRVACRHREMNKIPAGATEFLCKQGDGFQAAIVQEKKPFDLVIANILAGTLIDMKEDLAAVSDVNGYVILSGILREQAEDVLKSYANFRPVRRYDIDDWSTLSLQNTAT